MERRPTGWRLEKKGAGPTAHLVGRSVPGLPAAQRAGARLRVLCGELWSVDFEPQSPREEPGKTGRPAPVLQSDSLNHAGHASTIVIPVTSQLAATPGEDLFPLRVRLHADAGTGLREPTDLLIDQGRAISNRRLLRRLGVADAPTLARVEEALRWLTGA